ncbi:MAG: hypothetical protein PHH14_04545 [Candidatus Margulisbacteria bacterium]|nr:hypothetical protein [Candidatus Margulisiibacteriota bacterium]
MTIRSLSSKEAVLVQKYASSKQKALAKELGMPWRKIVSLTKTLRKRPLINDNPPLAQKLRRSHGGDRAYTVYEDAALQALFRCGDKKALLTLLSERKWNNITAHAENSLGLSRITGSNFSDREELLLRIYYPRGDWSVLTSVLPGRDKESLKHYASRIGIKMERRLGPSRSERVVKTELKPFIYDPQSLPLAEGIPLTGFLLADGTQRFGFWLRLANNKSQPIFMPPGYQGERVYPQPEQIKTLNGKVIPAIHFFALAEKQERLSTYLFNEKSGKYAGNMRFALRLSFDNEQQMLFYRLAGRRIDFNVPQLRQTDEAAVILCFQDGEIKEVKALDIFQERKVKISGPIKKAKPVLPVDCHLLDKCRELKKKIGFMIDNNRLTLEKIEIYLTEIGQLQADLLRLKAQQDDYLKNGEQVASKLRRIEVIEQRIKYAPWYKELDGLVKELKMERTVINATKDDQIIYSRSTEDDLDPYNQD